jgi:hypothetical protein
MDSHRPYGLINTSLPEYHRLRQPQSAYCGSYLLLFVVSSIYTNVLSSYTYRDSSSIASLITPLLSLTSYQQLSASCEFSVPLHILCSCSTGYEPHMGKSAAYAPLYFTPEVVAVERDCRLMSLPDTCRHL